MPTPTAAEIIERVKARYAGCRTYEDEGESTTVIIHGPKPWDRRTTKKPFKTAFARPTHFYFESADAGIGPESEWGRGVAWQNDRGVFKWSTLPVPRLTDDPLTLDSALAGLGGSAPTNVPRLLGCLEKFDAPLVELPASATRTEWSGVECFMLDGTWRGKPHRVWIECATFLLRRVESRTVFNDRLREQMAARTRAELTKPNLNEKQRAVLEQALARSTENLAGDFTTETTTIWHPRMDHDINPAVFEFTPPE